MGPPQKSQLSASRWADAWQEPSAPWTGRCAASPRSLTLEAASKIVDGALGAVRQESLLLLAIAVLDSGGHLVAFKRKDDCGILRVDIGTPRCAARCAVGISSRRIAERTLDPAQLHHRRCRRVRRQLRPRAG